MPAPPRAVVGAEHTQGEKGGTLNYMQTLLFYDYLFIAHLFHACAPTFHPSYPFDQAGILGYPGGQCPVLSQGSQKQRRETEREQKSMRKTSAVPAGFEDGGRGH